MVLGSFAKFYGRQNSIDGKVTKFKRVEYNGVTVRVKSKERNVHSYEWDLVRIKTNGFEFCY